MPDNRSAPVGVTVVFHPSAALLDTLAWALAAALVPPLYAVLPWWAIAIVIVAVTLGYYVGWHPSEWFTAPPSGRVPGCLSWVETCTEILAMMGGMGASHTLCTAIGWV